MDGLNELLQFVAWERLPYTFLILVTGWLSVALSGRFLDDLAERFTEWRLGLKKAKAIGRFFLYVAIAGLVVATLLQPGRGAEGAALIGTIGFALGYASQDLLASLITGIILLIDEPFQVGDRIAFGDYYGEVTEIGLRSVRLATLDDNLVTVPNSQFLNSPVASSNAGQLHAMVVVELFIGAAEDFGRARSIVAEAAATSRYVFLDLPIATLVSDKFMGERFVTVIKLKAYVFDVRYESAFASDVTERVKRAFRLQDIRTPDQQYRDLDLNGREAERGEQT